MWMLLIYRRSEESTSTLGDERMRYERRLDEELGGIDTELYAGLSHRSPRRHACTLRPVFNSTYTTYINLWSLTHRRFSAHWSLLRTVEVVLAAPVVGWRVRLLRDRGTYDLDASYYVLPRVASKSYGQSWWSGAEEAQFRHNNLASGRIKFNTIAHQQRSK